MADLIRAYDWTKTSLGPIASWSEALITSVNLMLFSPFSFAIYWGEEHVLLYNDHYRPFLSDKHPNALGSRGEVVWPEAWKVLAEPLRAAFEDGVSYGERNSYIPILINGVMQDRWFTYGFNPLFDGDEIVGVANQGHDDTVRVEAERELRKSREELSVGMEAASLGMWHFDPNMGVVVADERMHRIFGSPEKNGVVDYWLDLVHPDDRDRVGEHFAGVLAGKHNYEIEYRILRNGEIRWVRSKGKTYDLKEEPGHLFAIIEDITERKQAETALQQNEKLAAVGRLASTIAHEINNPLESVTNLLYLIQSSNDVDDMHSYVATAERELRRVSAIANQTLRFHKQSATAAPAHCHDLIGDTLALYQGRILNNGISVEKRKRAENPIHCLGGEIRQVLSNLIVNAIDAMPDGGRLLLRSHEVTNWRTGRKGLVLTVADTGSGMSPTVKRKAFDAFYSTKGHGGTGLGLWISKDIVARHEGTLRFRSCSLPGRSGTVFTIFLPHASGLAAE